MVNPQQIDIFLENNLRTRVENGRHNFLELVCEVLRDAGLTLNLRLMRERYDLDVSTRSLIHMKEPASENGLVFRCVYHMPFWQIETTEKRWDWQVANTVFDPSSLDTERASRFFSKWRSRLFGDLEPDDGDFVYVPLQGKLDTHRSFQSCSPIEMVKTVLAHTDRPVVIALHPNEEYSAKEIAALTKLANCRSDVAVTKGGMEKHLPNCRFIVTQNSSVAFNGYFLRKPAVLFADIDFHHIAIRTDKETFGEALRRAETHEPDYRKYIWWFWQINAINAGRPNAKERIRKRLISLGWPVR